MYRSDMYPATFIGGATGAWKVDAITTRAGEGLAAVARLQVLPAIAAAPDPAGEWTLHGVAGHVRYVVQREQEQLKSVTPPLGRPEATHAALIPIRKSPAWWALAQDQRRAIFEERSHHIVDSLPYIPRIARRLYHARELGQSFDFLTWFEFAAEHSAAFDELLAMLRSREEWTFVDREVEIRLSRL